MSSKPKQDLPAEEETEEDFMTRITQPRMWTVFRSEFIFQVFVDERFDEVLDMFKLYEGEKWNIIQNFKNHLSQKVDIYKYYKTVAFFRVYAWFILPAYRGQGLGKKLLECVINQQLPEMVHLGCNVISGLFTNKKSQGIANSLGLKTLYEANYPEWANQNNVTLPKNVKAENATVSVMACQINQKQNSPLVQQS
ncbi:uncharacterized protein LOC111033228 isoform X2 [Myzus persicae]|uniref:uncharacterized protein LOC111033228 isoform X2 n=1 Tax=Myzus persicae TaxID=13164 RepID=UPI000B9365D6|nr:uncharacterized protein LOC111033228 isoform X2 [Myzus persicae]